MRTTGTVKWYDAEKGFGFITLAPGQAVFMHRSQLPREGTERIHVDAGDRLEFEVRDATRGPEARNITRAP
jgi:CspA family cold shock protein